MIALATAKEIAFFTFNQQDGGDRTFKNQNDHGFKV